MRIRIKFRKQGDLKFIGHLDVMRYFQKLNRRAKIDISYSGGYSPHQEMSFATPLGLGITSDAEYVDFEMESVPAKEELIRSMNTVNQPEMEIIDAVLLPDDAKNAMSLLAAADYTLRFREGYEPADPDAFFDAFSEFIAKPEITVLKETKKSSRMTDIRPQIRMAERRGNDVFLRLDTGSASNLKPELVMQSFYEEAGLPYSPFTFMINRDELYGEEEGILKKLSDYGTDF